MKKKDVSLSGLMSTAEIGVFLNISRQQAALLCKEGAIEALKISPRLYLASRDSVKAYKNNPQRKFAPMSKKTGRYTKIQDNHLTNVNS